MLKKQRQPVEGLFKPHFTVKVNRDCYQTEKKMYKNGYVELIHTRTKHFHDYETARKFFRRVCRMYGIHENDIMHGPGYLATPEIKYLYSVILF